LGFSLVSSLLTLVARAAVHLVEGALLTHASGVFLLLLGRRLALGGTHGVVQALVLLSSDLLFVDLDVIVQLQVLGLVQPHL